MGRHRKESLEYLTIVVFAEYCSLINFADCPLAVSEAVPKLFGEHHSWQRKEDVYPLQIFKNHDLDNYRYFGLQLKFILYNTRTYKV